MKRKTWLLVAAFALWLGYWIDRGWGAMLDDALIHLRYADNLLRHHFITYDGVHHTFGASSLLYVMVLAALRAVFTSPLLPKVVSTIGHMLLLGLILRIVLRVASAARRSALGLGLVLMGVLCTPTAARWLDDGMETSLMLCFLCLLVLQVHHYATRAAEWAQPPVAWYLAAVVTSFLAVLLRIELLMLLTVSSGVLYSLRCSQRTLAAPERRTGQAADLSADLWFCSPFLVGGGAAALVILAAMNHLSPDTALAKSHGIVAWSSVLWATGLVLVGSYSFGVGMLLLWLASVAILLRVRRPALGTVLANLPFPILLVLASVRGQEIQGSRYIVWTFFYSLLWNILELGSAPAESSPQPWLGGDRLFLLPVVVVCLALQPVEARDMYRVLTSRATTLHRFEAEQMSVLAGQRGIASDIGFIGYFTQADVCDLAGLVNGREAARLTYRQRLERCTAQPAQFLYLDAGQLTDVGLHLDLRDWRVCDTFDFANVRTMDRHYLLIPAADEPLCTRITGHATLVSGTAALDAPAP
ncbi:MAG: hypothetical protein KGK08_01260 [Acidobacteriota bacterium]|nr:hypothetical protein [Acidobacteriota bacterium]